MNKSRRGVVAYLAIKKLLNGRQSLFAVHANANLLTILVLLDGEDDGRDVEVAEHRVN
jgi:hypothetical protein